MILSFFLLVYGFALCFLVGNFAWAILSKWFQLPFGEKLHFSIYPIIGMAVMSPFIGLYHFFFKIDWFLHVFFLSWLLGNIKVSKQLLIDLAKDLWTNKVMFLILLCGALLSIISRPGSGDIADYHLQAIKWAEHYANIIGLGNFNRPLANNNWWFNLQAFFGCSFLGVQSVYVGNAIFFISLFSWLYLSKTVSTGHQWIRFFYAAFIMLSLKTAFVGAVTPDIIVTGFIYLLLDLFLIGTASKELRIVYLLLMVLFATWIVTVKATAIMFFMIPLIWLFQLIQQKQWKNLGKLILLGLVFLIPWIIGNVLISGYLLYPFNQIDLFAVDWKVPAYFFEFDKIVLKNWGKVPGQDIFVTQQMSAREWLPVWFSKLDILNKGLVIGFLTSIPVFLIKIWGRKEIQWPVLFVFTGFFILFLNGPHPRFLFGYMVSAIAFAVYLLSEKIPFQLPTKWLPVLGVVLGGFLLVQTILTRDIAKGWLAPKPYPNELIEVKNIDGFEAFVTHQANTCWDKFPSSYYFIDSVGLIGTRVEEGFKVKTAP